MREYAAKDFAVGQFGGAQTARLDAKSRASYFRTLATVSPLALILGTAGLTLPAHAQAACTADTTACSAAGGPNSGGRGGFGGNGNGVGGNSTNLVGADTVQVPGSPSSGGTGGIGGAGENAGGNGGAPGSALTGTAVVTTPTTGVTGDTGPDGFHFGSGGGGGGTGVYFSGTSLTVNGGVTVNAGNGGAGGNSPGAGGGGGGGGGGAGVVSTAAGAFVSNAGTITGGQGGTGGGGTGLGGGGGGGGDGLLVLGDGTSISNAGSITGGGGGSGGIGSLGGAGTGGSGAGVNLVSSDNTLGNTGTITGGAANGTGTAGVGVMTNGNSTINNAGTISGGLNADGATHAAAIRFGGTSNVLNLLTGSTLVGDIQLITGAAATIAAQNNGFALGNNIVLGSGSLVAFNTTPANFSVTGVVSGAGSVAVTGIGTLTLSGNNSYTGGTTLAGGTLSVSSEANLGAASGSLTFNGGTLQVTGTSFTGTSRTINWGGGGFEIVDGTNNFVVSNSFTGNGGLTKSGAGTLTFTGSNNYSGGTTISAGTLQLGNGVSFGSITGNVVNNGIFAVNRSDIYTFGGTISGSGAFAQIGIGTTMLTGTNSYGGGTTMSRGTVQVSSDTNLGAASGALNFDGGGTLRVTGTAFTGTTRAINLGSGGGAFDIADAANNFTLGQSINGNGTLFKFGAGTLTLTGNSSLTGGIAISAGTLQLGNGGTSGSILGQVVNNGTFAINRSDTYTFGGDISGSGGFVQKGSGTTILTGTGRYGGGTTIANGTLQIGNGGTSGAITGNVFNNGRLIFNRSDDSTFAGSISGGGLFTKSGTGTLTLSGNNTYTGGTQLLGGTLVVQGGNAIGDNSSVIVLGNSTLRLLSNEKVATLSSGATDFGTVDLAAGNLTTSLNSTITTALYYGAITGAGGLVKDGSYKQVLAGTSNYTGGTTIQAGTLQLGDTTHQANLIGSVLNNATFEVVNADTSGLTTITNNSKLNFRNATSAGAATLTTTASGQTAFAGNSTAGNARLVTDAGGVVDFSASTGPAGNRVLSAGSIEGAGRYSLGANALTVGGNDLSTIVSGVIADGGASGGTGASLTKIGAGTLTLNGQSTYTGATNVNAGKLVVGDDSHGGASLASAVTVNNGGTLGGIGTVGGITANAGGIVAPGNSIGTLNVAGNVSFAAGSIYQVEANAAGQSDKIIATDTATLAGGNVLALAQTGTYAPQTVYTILTANGGVNGTFTDVTSSLTFLTPTLSYDANDVFLTLARNATSLTSVATTPNQIAVAGALDASGQQRDPLMVAVLNQNAAGARQAFDALSGEVHASAQTAMLDDSRYLRDAVLGRLRQASFAGSSGPTAALGSGGPQTAVMDSLSVSSALAYAGTDRSAFPVKAPPLARPAPIPDTTTFWAQGVGAWGRLNGDGNAAGMTRDLAGFFSGVDHRFAPNWIAGIAGGYTSSSVHVGNRASSADIDTAHLAGYVGATYGALSLRGGASASFSTLDTSRSIVFPGFFDAARARYDATTAQVFGEIGYGLSLGRTALEPFAGLAWAHLNTDSFAETGGTGAAALRGSGNDQDVGYSSLGARIATSFALTNGMQLTPRASVAWQYAFGDVTPTAALAFQSLGTGFSVAGVPLARNAALVEGGLDLRVTPQASIGIAYVGQLADRVQDHSVKASFSWKF
ncbi:autotransporter domain-containing protein [Bradyrhizobium sp. USDA 3315]